MNRYFLIGGIAVCLVLAGLVSPFASPHPDGLEHVAAGTGIAAAEQPAWTASPIPDYAVPGIEHEALATGLAGILGTLIVLAAGWAVARLVRRRPT
jgi:hypothetical protein